MIIGAGIAGASLARGFLRRGIKPVIIDPEPDLQSAASGNPAGLIMPRLDLQDRPESRFFLSAYLYALAQYQGAGAVTQSGILHLAKSSNEAKRFEKLFSQCPLPAGQMQMMTTEQAKDVSGLNLSAEPSGLYFPGAQTINPKLAIKAWTQDCPRITQNAAKINRQGDEWEVLNGDGETLAITDKLFVTVGANVLDLAGLDVRFTRGQICWGEAVPSPKTAITYGGYCAPYEDGILLGATHDHVGPGQSSTTNTQDTRNNIDEFTSLSGQKINSKNWQARAAIRVTTKDTLPISMEMADGLFVMSGLGSRGMMMAPLLGEFLVCKALGEPTPLDKQTQIRFHKRAEKEII